ncbi:hypothetical protein FEM03_01675 [Phragmitibacter flavus]|uniref:Outer membrane beta-barrel protein n=1 Tax=Phragmitibacter flavus TaxID=2576071 RepID=A0A5R8KKF9_9BACT|nr:DUF5777 family beta-barrel protein [Phragmitibacter flavus]TLD72806.1 hypothetical protein FEM03_01675 [Phragmitibacter flavus]
MQKSFPRALLAMTVLTVSGTAFAQGLLGLTQSVDYEANIPFSVSTSVRAGYDNIKYSSAGQEDVESYFLQSGIGLRYGNNHRVTPWNVGVDLGVTHYLDSVERGEDTFYNTRVSFNISHQISRRLTVGNNFYATYEIEPDYGAGVTTGRRAGQYIYGYNNTTLAYAWTRRVSTTTGYTVDGIKYVDDNDVAGLEDRFSHTFSQQVSYALSRRTSLTAEYRFRLTDYDSSPRGIAGENYVNPDSTSHFVLIGVDQAWSDRLTASVRAGAELYQSDRTSETAPYVEGSLNYAISRKTSLRWHVQAGYDGSELGLFNSRYSYRTGVVVSHQFTRRLSGNSGIHYVHSDFEGSEDVPSASEDELNASIGLTYNFWQNLSLDANYSFTTLAADQEFRDYDRHRLSVGLNATF